MMEYNNITVKAIIVSSLYWLLDSTIHVLLFGEDEFEFIPSEMNELWMRSTIVILLILFGLYADKQTKLLLEKEKEKYTIFKATIKSSQHILNNLMNQMSYLKMVADEKGAFNSEDTETYKCSINEGRELVLKLSAVDELTEENIINSVYPK